MTRAQHLPDLPLVGLTIDDLYDLVRRLRPMSEQFDTASLGMPFVAPYAGRAGGIVEDTAVGEIFSSIGTWSHEQKRRIYSRLRDMQPKNSDEAAVRASMLLEDEVMMGDWAKSAKLFAALHQEAAELHGRSSQGARQ